MIFSSPEFCLAFLPSTVILYYCILRSQYKEYTAFFIFFVSLVYYTWWRPDNIWIILFSILANYTIGQAIANAVRLQRLLFVCGVAGNLLALGWYKYTDFVITNLNTLLHTSIPLQNIILPIGISFFTFQQIAYLTDIYTKKHDPEDEGFINYCCFVCFYPQLVAGPIVHHQEMMPQFFDSANQVVRWENIFYGIVIFVIGLTKKLIIADNLSPIARYCFDTAPSLTFMEATFGSITYSLQLYFDFSGYSDMAVGAALLFNIRLPWNFNSPYQAENIQDFWRRWHITLSRWLRDYLYIPLGGNRRGAVRTTGNLVLTFLLGGLWHGAAWTFLIWGALHGLALVVQRLWHNAGYHMPRLAGWLVTFVFVNLAWVVFRAPSMERLQLFAEAFTGQNGLDCQKAFFREISRAVGGDHTFTVIAGWVLVCLAVTLLAPNTYKLTKLHPRILLWFAVLLTFVCLFGLSFPPEYPEFIYSKF